MDFFDRLVRLTKNFYLDKVKIIKHFLKQANDYSGLIIGLVPQYLEGIRDALNIYIAVCTG